MKLMSYAVLCEYMHCVISFSLFEPFSNTRIQFLLFLCTKNVRIFITLLVILQRFGRNSTLTEYAYSELHMRDTSLRLRQRDLACGLGIYYDSQYSQFLSHLRKNFL